MTHRKKEFVPALPERCFWVHFGPIVSDLKELRKALKDDITDEQFKHHVSKEKNDFATWISDTLQDKSCATSLKRVHTKKGTIRALGTCLVKYK